MDIYKYMFLLLVQSLKWAALAKKFSAAHHVYFNRVVHLWNFIPDNVTDFLFFLSSTEWVNVVKTSQGNNVQFN